jgi:uncharacterized protein Usg
MRPCCQGIESEADVSAIPLWTPDFEAQLHGQRLTTAEILYYIPDHPGLLQSFLWQTLDEAPDFPRIQRFLAFWRREIEAVIHSVQITSTSEVTPGRITPVRHVAKLN